MSLYDTGGFIDRALDIGDTSRYGDIESGLTLTRTESPGTVSSFSSTERTQDAVFACDVYFPETVAEGVLFEMGAGAIGHVAAINSSGTFIFRAGDGATTVDPTITAVVELTVFPSDGKKHTVVWDIRINPGRIRVWIDNDLKGTGDTSTGGALDGSSWAGGDNGGYLQADTSGVSSGVAGALSGADWPGGRINVSDLRYYQNQLVTATAGNRKNSGVWSLDAVYNNLLP